MVREHLCNRNLCNLSIMVLTIWSRDVGHNADRFAEELSKVVAERGVLALLPQRPIPPNSEPAIKVRIAPLASDPRMSLL
jgi:hypothetical protein